MQTENIDKPSITSSLFDKGKFSQGNYSGKNLLVGFVQAGENRHRPFLKQKIYI